MRSAKCLLGLVTVATLIIPNPALIIQAELDVDDESESLIKALIDKMDSIIDPNTQDAFAATKLFVKALLKIGPTITIKGGLNSSYDQFALSLSLTPKVNRTVEKNALSLVMEEIEPIDGDETGLIELFVQTVESYLLVIANIIGHAIMTNIVANLMHDMALYSSTNQLM